MDMRVGRDINVGGNLFVHDESVLYQPLSQCTSEELRDERNHRRSLLTMEGFRKFKSLAIVWIVSGLVLVPLWFYFHGKENLATFIVDVGGFVIALCGIRWYGEPNDFELRQMGALDEIKHLLKERGAR